MRTVPVESISVTGILVDTFCYAKETSEDDDPRVDSLCAEESLKLGYPVAVVVEADSVWVLSENPRVVGGYVNDSVRVQGDIRSEGVLIPRSFERKDGGDWEKVF